MKIDHHKLRPGPAVGRRLAAVPVLIGPAHNQLTPHRPLLALHKGLKLAAAGKPVLLGTVVDVVHRQPARGRVAAAGMVAEAHPSLLERHQRILEPRERPTELVHLIARDLPAVSWQKHAVAEALLEKLLLHLVFGLDVVGLLLAPHPKQRWLGHVDMPLGHQPVHLPVEEGQ